MSVRSLYNFRESRFTSLSHGLRVYIYGADVTPWLKGDLSVTYGNRDSFNSATFELSNPRKVWQLTRANLAGTWRQAVGEYNEQAKLNIFRWKNSPYINPSFNMDITTQVLGQRDSTAGNKAAPGPSTYTPPPTGTERRYRLAVNDCIFSRQDPIRIFMKNPYSNSSNEWVEIFCGFIHDHPVTTNYSTGESTVRVSCYCIRQLLTKMRVQLNNLAHKGDPQPFFDRGFFSDFQDPSKAKHPFAQTTLENTIKDLILGSATAALGEKARLANGVGEFKMGNVLCYDPSAPKNTLERWHLMTLFGVNKVPYPNSADEDFWLTEGEMKKIGETTIYLPETFGQGPGGRYLHFLLPYEGSGAGALVQSTLDASPPKAVEWTTRWEIIRDFASKLDFQVTTSPSGDILVEFPFYSLTPHVFSTQGGAELNPYVLPNATARIKARQAADEANAASVAKVEFDINQGTIPYGLGALLTFELHQLEDTLNDEAEDFPTVLQVDGGMAFEQGNVKGEEPFSNLRAFVYSPVLVARYGVIAEQMQIPFAGQRSGDQATQANGEKPVAKRMAKLALIEYMKRLADSSTWDGSVVYRPFLFPNRPVWLKRSGRIGVLTSVTNRWSIGKSAGTSFSLNMLMSERYDPSIKGLGGKQQTEYRLPTGAANMPIDYADIWGDSEKGHPKSGVQVEVGTKNPPTSAANGGAGSVGSDKPAPASTQSKSPFAVTSNVSIKYTDSTYMYKPFSDAIEAALKAAAEEGFPAISITSTYRSPEKQLYLRNNPQARAKKPNGDPVEAAEPWKSCHQYGMAIDIKIAGNDKRYYRRFSELCGENVFWGERYNGDYVHYEWQIRGGKTSLQADKFRRAAGFTDKDVGNTAYLKDVWKGFDALRGNPTDTTPPPTPTPTSTTAAESRSSSTGTGDAAAAPPCSPLALRESGMTAIAEAAKTIPRVQG